MDEARDEALARPHGWVGALGVVAVWLVVLTLLVWALFARLSD